MSAFRFVSLPSLVYSFITISNIIYNKQEHYDQVTARNQWNPYYDYVIVGGGTAGSVVASRLSEDPSITVLLLEAGGSETVSSNTPGLTDSFLGTVMDWKFMSTSQNFSCQAMNNQRCLLSSGRVIGGTSSINRMYYLRGNPNDYDHWQNKLGLKHWGWKDVFPFMIRNENQTDPERAKSGYFGLNGPVSIEKTPDHNSILESFVLSSKMSGYKIVDLNTGVASGTAILQSNTRNGRRMSTSSVFLQPHLKRPNLHILSNSFVYQILFESSQAVGVNFYRNWKTYTVHAKREIVVCAGTLNSPKLLMLSGVGPRDELRKHKIEVVANLPVGENLHDHVGSMGMHFLIDQPELTVTKDNLKQYFSHGKGPLSEKSYAATLFRSTLDKPVGKVSSVSKTSADLMLLGYANSLAAKEVSGELTEQRTNLNKDVWNGYYGLEKNKTKFTIIPIVLKPKSRGWVRLNSNNPLDMPAVNPNYLHHPRDRQQMIEAMRETLRLASAYPLQQFNAEWMRTVVPGCEQLRPAQPSLVEKTLTEKNMVVNTTTTYVGLVSSFFSRIFDSKRKHFSYKSASVSKRSKRSSPLSSNKTLNVDNYDQYWFASDGAGHRAQSWKQEELIDGFSSNNDMSIIETVWSSHKKTNPNKKPFIFAEKSTQSDTTTSTVTREDKTLSVTEPTRSMPSQTPSSTVMKFNAHGTVSGKSNSKQSDPKMFTQVLDESISVMFNEHMPTIGYHHHQSTVSTTNTPEMTNQWNDHITTQPSIWQHSTVSSHSSSDNSQSISDQYLQCVARKLTMPIGDYVGTCRMGPDGDWRRVVDPEFRVIGVEGLRVVDASVIPEIVTGGIAPVAIMIGERGAEFIKDDLRRKRKK